MAKSNSNKAQGTLNKLRQHRISIAKAAKECWLSLSEMIDVVKENKIDWTGYSKMDLERDLKILKEK